jgi:hypothetical protein
MGFKLSTKRARKREFLDEVNLVVSWDEWVALLAPHAPAPGAKGRLLKGPRKLSCRSASGDRSDVAAQHLVPKIINLGDGVSCWQHGLTHVSSAKKSPRSPTGAQLLQAFRAPI